MIDRFKIDLPTSLTGFAPDLTFTSRSADWREVIAGKNGPRQSLSIKVPNFIFEPTHRVADEIAFCINEKGEIEPASGTPAPGCIAVVQESPHRDEFEGRGGRALGPLRNSSVRSEVTKHLARLIASVSDQLGESLIGRSIALVNAVQYQASLQAIMQHYEGKLRNGVRTSVWKAIFREGGAADFHARLARYDPRLVLLATTGVVRNAVRASIAGRPQRFSWTEVNYHPSYWGRSAPLIGPLNSHSGDFRP